jgi:hypothetical protein
MPAAISIQTSACLGTTAIPPQLNPKIDGWPAENYCIKKSRLRKISYDERVDPQLALLTNWQPLILQPIYKQKCFVLSLEA